MNANELADILQQSDFLAMDFAEDAATMLRQQQAEIDNLAIVKYLNGVTISKLYAEIEALKSHPVKEFFEDEPQAEELHEIMQSNAELTDEEILVIAYEILEVWNTKEALVDFARAILRKAQE